MDTKEDGKDKEKRLLEMIAQIVIFALFLMFFLYVVFL